MGQAAIPLRQWLPGLRLDQAREAGVLSPQEALFVETSLLVSALAVGSLPPELQRQVEFRASPELAALLNLLHLWEHPAERMFRA
jgi:hypothetical protein